MGLFVQSEGGGVENPSFCTIAYASLVGSTSPMINSYLCCSYFSNWFNKKRIQILFPWNNPFVIPWIAQYSLPYQSVQHPLWIYRQTFPPHLCILWVIKIIPKRPIQKTDFVCWPISPPHTTPIYYPPKKLHNILHINIFLSPPWKIL